MFINKEQFERKELLHTERLKAVCLLHLLIIFDSLFPNLLEKVVVSVILCREFLINESKERH